MVAFRLRKQSLAVLVLGLLLSAVLAVAAAAQTSESVEKKKAEKKKQDLKAAYQIHNKKCLACHVSVADPEKPGRTRDEWFLVVTTMHGYGFELSPKESDAIVDLLFRLRPGIEKEPG